MEKGVKMKDEKIDVLNRDDFIDNIQKLIDQMSKIKRGCCFSIEGNWGIGKTFVIEKLEKRLKIKQTEETNSDKYFVFHYNCWQYDYYEEPSVAIITAILSSIEEEEAIAGQEVNTTIKAGMQIAKEKVKEIAKKYLETKTGIDIVGIIDNLYTTKETIQKSTYEFDELFSFNKTINVMRKSLEEIASERTLVLVVDELDRCIPQYAIKVLERLHHIFSGLDNVVVVLAIDRGQLEYSVEEMFGKRINRESMDVDKYLKKFIDFSLTLDNGIINETFWEKYKFYFEKFCIDSDSDDLVQLKDLLPKIFKGIDIRRQEKIIEKTNIIHSLLCNKQVDISVLLFEILFEILKIESFGDMKNVVMINGAECSMLENEFAIEKIDLLKKMEIDAWHGTKRGERRIEKKRVLLNINGKVFWYFANIFNKDKNPYIVNSLQEQGMSKCVELCTKYVEYSNFIN